jgi:hypothetical protein
MTNSHITSASTPATAPTPQETLIGLLEQQHRLGPPIRTQFLQERGGARAAGPLRHFVTERRHLALKQYLLLHCLAMAKPWDAWLPAGAWARALGNTSKNAEATVSRNWTWLRDKHLIETKRDKRILRIYLKNEDGSNSEYERSRNYFTLPLAYFRDGWHSKLSLPATAVLLIALDRSRGNTTWFELRKEPAAGWFGISADTLQRGLDELRDEHKLLEPRFRVVQDIRTRTGVTTVAEYQLLGDFRNRRAKAIDTEEVTA